jgi:hypothetical protein
LSDPSQAAKKLAINYSSAKSICQIYKREGRTNKKVFKKNFENDESTPDNEDFSLSQLTSKEESESSSTKRSRQILAKPSQDTHPVKKLDFPAKPTDIQSKIIKPEEVEQLSAKLEKPITIPNLDFLKASNPLQAFSNAINQAKSDIISPNKITLAKPLSNALTNPQVNPSPIYYKPNQSLYSYNSSSGPIIIQQQPSFSPYQNLSYSTQGFVRQVTNPQNHITDQLSIYQNTQTQSQGQTSDQMYQGQQMMPQGSLVVLGNNYPQQMNTPYIIAGSPNVMGGQQNGGYQFVQPVIYVMQQQPGMMMGYQQNGMQDSNVMIQSQQVQQQVQMQPQQSSFGLNNLYQNLAYGKATPNIQYILMKNAEDQQLLQKK